MPRISHTLRRCMAVQRRCLPLGQTTNAHQTPSTQYSFSISLLRHHRPSPSLRQFSSSSTEIAKPPSSYVVPTQSHNNNDVLVSTDGVSGKRIDFDVQAKIEGNESQIVTITLEPGQVLRAESGAMMYMTEGVEMNTTTGGGLSAGFQRMLTGQNMFISDYTYTGTTQGQVALGTDFPSKIVRLSVQEYGGKIVCQKGALLCASHTIDIQMEFSKNFSTGFFGGEGFVLQGLTGDGDVFVKAGGTLIRRDLREGEQLRISSGCLVAFSAGVDYGASSKKCSLYMKELMNAHPFLYFVFFRRPNGQGLCKCVCWWGRSFHDNSDRSRSRMATRWVTTIAFV